MKAIFESVISRKAYDLPAMLKQIDAYHIEGKLTDADREELYNRAREGAKPENGVDVMAKLAELEGRVHILEEKLRDAATGDGSEAGGEAQTPEEYVPGKWYYSGNRVTFEGAAYTCTAPAEQVCTWSPYEYPAYWTKDETKEE